MRELDDELGPRIVGRRLSREDLDAGGPIAVGSGTDGPKQCNGLENIEKLTFVLVNALDMHIVQRGRVDDDAG